jgi:protein ImuA
VRPNATHVNPRPPRADQRRRLERLRAELARLERSAGTAGGRATVLPLGLAGIDRLLPGGGLPRGCLHELTGEPDHAAAAGFAAALLGRLMAEAGHAVWIGPRDDLFAPGLAALGLAPERLIVVRARARDARLWALEEALRSRGLIAALAEIDRLSLTQSRRLQLAAEARGVSAFLLRPPLDGTRAGATASAATTRWRIAAAASRGEVPRDLGPPRWRVELVRCRGGRSGAWLIEWRPGGWHEIPDPLPLAAGSGDRAPAPVRPEPAAGRRRA